MAGELEITGDEHTKSSECKGRIAVLKKIMYFSTTYSFTTLRKYYAAVL